MPTTLAELLTDPTQAQVEARIVAYLQDEGFPVTDWEVGGVERTRLKTWTKALVDLVTSTIPTITAGQFIDYATAAWMRLLAKQRYNLDYYEATRTTGLMTLTCAPTAGPHTVTAGTLIAKFSSGNRYVNTTGGVLSAGGTLELEWQSEEVNDSPAGKNYIDPSDGTVTLVTPLTGVTIANPASTFSEDPVPVTDGTSTGTLNLSGTPSGQYQITVQIDVAGQAGVAEWSYSVNGGAFVEAGAVSSLADVGGSGITITLTNGSITPSFNEGDSFTFAAPGTWITEQGTDIEATAALASRCRNRWPSLAARTSTSPTLGYYDLLAREASAQVTQTRVVTDGTINNKLYLVIAGQGGVLPLSVINDVQDFVDARVHITDYPVVVSPTTRAIELAGVLTVERAKRDAALAAAETAIRTYINSVGINGTVRLAALVDILMDIDGVIDIEGLTINGSAENLVLPVDAGAYELPQWDETLSEVLTTVSG
jgi:hypothetical protein